jgi:putative lipoic acid-binding regulatory protein
MKTKKNKPLLEFPCEFNLKVLGHNDKEFEIAVLEILQKQRIKLRENSINTRISSNHKYLAITVIFTAKSKKQIDKLYQALHDCNKVLMIL